MTQPLGREEALASLAKRHFTSHGPATLEDFTWWSGLSIGNSRRALEMVQPELSSEMVDEKTYWFADGGYKAKKSTFLLPVFDEFIISYKDRSATLTFENHERTVSSNGMFHPTIVVNGETIGVWKRTIKKNTMDIQFNYFAEPDHATQKTIEEDAARYGNFSGKAIHFTEK